MLKEGLVAVINDVCKGIHPEGTKVYVQLEGPGISVQVCKVVGFRIQYKSTHQAGSTIGVEYYLLPFGSSTEYFWSEDKYVSVDPCVAFDFKG